MNKLKQLSEKIKENIDLLIESETEKKSKLALAILDMKNRIIVAKDLIATAIAEIERLKHARKDAINAEENWMKIVDSDNTDSEKADEARRNLHKQQQRVNDLDKQIFLQETVVSELKTRLASFHRRFKDASERAETLSQQQKQAELRTEFYQLLAESDDPDQTGTFKQAEMALKEAEEKASMWEKRNQTPDEDIEATEKDFDVDAALAALKNDILGSSQND